MRYPLTKNEMKSTFSFLSKLNGRTTSEFRFPINENDKQNGSFIPVIDWLAANGFISYCKGMNSVFYFITLKMSIPVIEQEIKHSNAKEKKEKWRPITIALWALGVSIASIILSIANHFWR